MVTTIKRSLLNIAISLIFCTAFFFTGFVIQLDEGFFNFYLALYLMFFILFIIWLFYLYIIDRIVQFFKELKSNKFKMKNPYNFINFKPINRFKKIDANINYFFIYFSGVSVASLFLGIVNENKDLNKGTNWIMFVILIFIISFLLVELAKRNSEKYSTHYKFVGNFHNFSPVKLYLDRITDNSTHILSDKDKKYKAIKYLKNEQSEFVIELYQIEQREVQKTLNKF